jgi:hypothetical protein
MKFDDFEDLEISCYLLSDLEGDSLCLELTSCKVPGCGSVEDSRHCAGDLSRVTLCFCCDDCARCCVQRKIRMCLDFIADLYEKSQL